MNNSAMTKSDIIKLNITVQKDENTNIHNDIELFYILEGTVKLTIEGEIFTLNQDDFTIINASKKHSYKATGDVLLGIFTISYSKLSDMLNRSFLVFWCNSAIDKSEAYEDARRIIRNVFNQYFENSEEGYIYLMSQFYSLLHVLDTNFLLSPKDNRFAAEKSKFDERLYTIVHYIRSNYNKDISLRDLSAKLYLSNAYLSKYIKKNLGISFISYLNNVRLQHAVSDLLYNDTSIMRTALDNGFPNVAAFNKAFREMNGMTPSAYKKKVRNQVGIKKSRTENENLIQERLNTYFEKNPYSAPDSSINQNITADVSHTIKYDKNWNRMINIGTAADLLRSDIQEHILILKNKLQFLYVRFWDVFSSEMYLDINAADKQYNFDRLDRVLDFLVANGIRPYMELGYKPNRLLKSTYSVLIEKEMEGRAESAEAWELFIHSLTIHLINRYGIEELETWYFELWKEEVELDRVDQVSKTKNDEDFFNIFDLTSGTMKRYSPNFRVGGAGLGIRFGQKNFIEILKGWKKNHILPDFLSLYCYPFIPGEVEGEQIKKQSTDRSYMKNQLIMARELMQEVDFQVPELHVTEWNSTVSNRNVLNDHCSKGAYIMKNIIDIIGLADLAGYWVGSDLFADFYDSQAILNGGCGLITKDGIYKPAFYAMEFMNKSGKNLIQKGGNYMISDYGHSNYGIACHNYKHYDYNYYLHQENEIDVKKIKYMFLDRDKIHLSFQLQNVKNGSYQIKIHSINQYYGSVQDEWIRMDLITTATKEEIDYLKRVCTSRLAVKRCEVTDSTLNIEAFLESNEIQYIQISYQY